MSLSGGKKLREARDHLVVNLSACKYTLVREAAERLGYEVVEDESEMWDLCWSDLSVSADRVQRLLPFQRLNHFPGMLEICRKAALSRHMARMAARLPAEYRFYPPSLVLPDQLDDLLTALRRNKARAEAAAAVNTPGKGGGGDEDGVAAAAAGVSTFILKPSAGTQGRGIALVQYPHQLAEAGDVGSCVAQAYLSNPLLLDGFKFDLRVYALVSSVDPLRIHLYDEGLARLATEPYKAPNPANLRATTMHLTNYAVNKGAAGFVSADAAPPGGGSKRPMTAVLAQLAAQYGTTQEALMESIADVVTKTVMAIQPLLAHTYHTSLSTAATAAFAPACGCPSLDHIGGGGADPTSPCDCPPSLCFELLGFDIMFDTDLQPWLLEVNHSPSFASDSRLDRTVKGEMLARAMLMLDQHAEARRAYLEAEARAQNERLYSSPYSGGSSGFSGAAGVGGTGAGPRRAMSALPRSRKLQVAAAVLEEITAHSAALLAAGGHVWGGGGSSSVGASRSTGIRPHSGDRTQQTGGSGGVRRSLSFSGGGSSGRGGSGGGAAADEGARGVGGEGSASSCRGFRLVFPTALDSDRRRYCRVLQTAADLYPQQRCQCPWCTRRREIALLGMSSNQMILTARPPSAVAASTHFSGHLPLRSGGGLSARGSGSRPRIGSASSTSSSSSVPAAAAAVRQRTGASFGGAGGAGGAGSDECSDNEGGGVETRVGSSSLGLGGGGGGLGGVGGGNASRPSSSTSEGLRGKPPRPGSTSRSSSSSIPGVGTRPPAAGGGATASPPTATTLATLTSSSGSSSAAAWLPSSSSPSSPSSLTSLPKSYGSHMSALPGPAGAQALLSSLSHPTPGHLAYPAPPTMASMLAGHGSYGSYGGFGYGYGHTASSGSGGGGGGGAGSPGAAGGNLLSPKGGTRSGRAAQPRPLQPQRRSSATAVPGTPSSTAMTSSVATARGSGSGKWPGGRGGVHGSDGIRSVSGDASGGSGGGGVTPSPYKSVPAATVDGITTLIWTPSQSDPPPAGQDQLSVHQRSDQMLGALRPLTHSHSHPQTRLSSSGRMRKSTQQSPSPSPLSSSSHPAQLDTTAAAAGGMPPQLRPSAHSSGLGGAGGGGSIACGGLRASQHGGGGQPRPLSRQRHDSGVARSSGSGKTIGSSRTGAGAGAEGVRASVELKRNGGAGASPSRWTGAGASARAAHHTSGTTAAARRRGGGGSAGSNDVDNDSDDQERKRRGGGGGGGGGSRVAGGRVISLADGLRRSYSCSELEAAFKYTLEAAQTAAAAAMVASNSSRPPPPAPPSMTASQTADSVAAMTARMSYIAQASKHAAGSGAAAAVAAADASVTAGDRADLEALAERVRAATVIKNSRYVSLYMQGGGGGSTGRTGGAGGGK